MSIRFEVPALEFCRALDATAQFKSTEKTDPLNAIRCFAGSAELTMAATDGFSIAASKLPIEGAQGGGIFTIPGAQVRPILAIFKRTLPKDASRDEYVLSIEATDTAIHLKDESALFEKDAYSIVQPEEDELLPDQWTQSQYAMHLAAGLAHSLESAEPVDIARFGMPSETVKNLSRAARIWGGPIVLKPAGERITATCGEGFIVRLGLAGDRPETKPEDRYESVGADARREWAERMEAIGAHGVIA